MKKLMSASVVVLFLVAAITVHAQGTRGQGGQGGGGFSSGFSAGNGGANIVLRNNEVKAALGLTEEQVTKLEALLAQPTERLQITATERQSRQAATLDAVAKILNAEQLKKAQILAFQAAGGLDGFPPRATAAGDAAGGNPSRGTGGSFGWSTSNAISNTFAMSALGLTAEQKKELFAILAKDTEQMRALRPTGGNTGEAPQLTDDLRAKIVELRAETKAATLKLLTDEQKATAKKLFDEAPDFVKPQSRSGRNTQ